MLLYFYELRRTLRVRNSAHRVPHTFGVIIGKTSIMFKIVPDDFSQPLGHLSIIYLTALNLQQYIASPVFLSRRVITGRRPVLCRVVLHRCDDH